MTLRQDTSARGRMALVFLVGLLAGIMLTVLARRVLSPPAALAPGHPGGEEPIAPRTAAAPRPLDIPIESVPGNGTAVAPEGYPVKGNGRSGIYHVPGGFSYDRTIASIFFRTPAAAEEAGFRAAKA